MSYDIDWIDAYESAGEYCDIPPTVVSEEEVVQAMRINHAIFVRRIRNRLEVYRRKYNLVMAPGKDDLRVDGRT